MLVSSVRKLGKRVHRSASCLPASSNWINLICPFEFTTWMRRKCMWIWLSKFEERARDWWHVANLLPCVIRQVSQRKIVWWQSKIVWWSFTLTMLSFSKNLDLPCSDGTPSYTASDLFLVLMSSGRPILFWTSFYNFGLSPELFPLLPRNLNLAFVDSAIFFTSVSRKSIEFFYFWILKEGWCVSVLSTVNSVMGAPPWCFSSFPSNSCYHLPILILVIGWLVGYCFNFLNYVGIRLETVFSIPYFVIIIYFF